MDSPRAFARQSDQESYFRRHEDSYYQGLLTKNNDQAFTLNFHGSTSSHNISRSVSNIDDKRHQKLSSYLSAKLTATPSENSVIDFISEPFKQSSEKSSIVPKTGSFAFLSTLSDSSYNSLGDPHDSEKEPDYQTLLDESKSTFEKTYVVNKRKMDLSSIPLPQSAASFCSGISPQMEVVELYESKKRLNLYLKAQKDEVYAGVPGRFLHAVIGQDVSDIGSIASTIMYAFYLHETQNTDQFCTVPVINMKRADLSAHTNLQWLLDSCQIDQTNLIFVDVDLSYYDLFGSLKLVLLNGHKLPAKQEALKDAVVEILTCKKGESAYPWVKIVTETEDCSCCTFVAEKFALTSPKILVGKGFSRLLLAGILLDSGNLTNAHCSSKDKYMATPFNPRRWSPWMQRSLSDIAIQKTGCNKSQSDQHLAQRFQKMDKISVNARLTASHIGMSSVTISLGQLLAHEDTATQEIKYFQRLEKLRLLMIVSGYNDKKNNFKREILVSAESAELMKNLLFFFNSNATNLPLKDLHRPGLREETRAFEIDKVIYRERLLSAS